MECALLFANVSSTKLDNIKEKVEMALDNIRSIDRMKRIIRRTIRATTYQLENEPHVLILDGLSDSLLYRRKDDASHTSCHKLNIDVIISSFAFDRELSRNLIHLTPLLNNESIDYCN